MPEKELQTSGPAEVYLHLFFVCNSLVAAILRSADALFGVIFERFAIAQREMTVIKAKIKINRSSASSEGEREVELKC